MKKSLLILLYLIGVIGCGKKKQPEQPRPDQRKEVQHEIQQIETKAVTATDTVPDSVILRELSKDPVFLRELYRFRQGGEPGVVRSEEPGRHAE